ncbi:hypothetical protein C8R47DRAFT_1189465 [Mycena vitilis]|nr:hypothetical protein C8R47DRAFT_1189465 [Mycena vitilis]
MSSDTLVDAALSAIPVPGLSTAWTVFKFIIDGVNAVQASKGQLELLAQAVAQLLTALNSGFKDSKLIMVDCAVQLNDLKKLLDEIHQFVDKERKKNFLKAWFTDGSAGPHNVVMCHSH